MSDSILLTVKKTLGVSEEDTSFDAEIILAINTAIMELNQLGIGPEDGLIITNSDQHWHELIGIAKDYEGVKTYISLKSRLIFDPPSSSFVLDSYKKTLDELAWRINAQVESDLTKPTPTP